MVSWLTYRRKLQIQSWQNVENNIIVFNLGHQRFFQNAPFPNNMSQARQENESHSAKRVGNSNQIYNMWHHQAVDILLCGRWISSFYLFSNIIIKYHSSEHLMSCRGLLITFFKRHEDSKKTHSFWDRCRFLSFTKGAQELFLMQLTLKRWELQSLNICFLSDSLTWLQDLLENYTCRVG